MVCPVKVFVACHKNHENPVAYQNMTNAIHLTEDSKRDGQNYEWRTYIAADDRKALAEALDALISEGSETMTNTSTRKYEIDLPHDTADLLDAFCKLQEGSPTQNTIGRVIRDGIESIIALHPRIGHDMDYKPHNMSTAMRLKNI